MIGPVSDRLVDGIETVFITVNVLFVITLLPETMARNQSKHWKVNIHHICRGITRFRSTHAIGSDIIMC